MQKTFKTRKFYISKIQFYSLILGLSDLNVEAISLPFIKP
jgi:hypothetical protein